jgi:hypothetical protein
MAYCLLEEPSCHDERSLLFTDSPIQRVSDPEGASSFVSTVRDVIPIDLRYRTLLEVSHALNSQRHVESFWPTLTEGIRPVIPWDRAGLLFYEQGGDSFRFHALETSLPKRVLQPSTILPRAGTAVGWVYDHRQSHIRPRCNKSRSSWKISFMCKRDWGGWLICRF